MNDRNNVDLSGSLAREAEIRSTQSGKEWVTFTLEVKGGTDAQPRKSFVKCKAFGKSFVSLLKEAPVGARFALGGSLEPSSYQNKAGDKVWTMEVYVRWMDALVSKDQPAPPVEEPPF